jgi:Zn-dependent protease
MAMAGPVANLGLAIVSWTILKVGLEVQWFSPPPPDKAGFEALVAGTSPLGDSIAPILSIMCSLNLILFLFNLIPVPPLDGSGVITLAMSPDQARRFQEFVSQPMVNIIGLVIAWRVSDLIIAPVYGVMVRALWTSW